MPDAPDEPVSASELIRRQQDILLRNAENQRKRQRLAQLSQERDVMREQLELLREQLSQVEADLTAAQKDAAQLNDESTAELEESIRRIDEVNQAVRTNAERRRAEEEAELLGHQYRKLTEAITQVRTERTQLLNGADLPLPGLSVENGKLLYRGQPWGNLSGSDQLKVSAAIVRRLKPECGFVLMDKLEQMDPRTLSEFGTWLEQESLQVIATRVSTGGECSILISDGLAVQPQPQAPTWTKGVF